MRLANALMAIGLIVCFYPTDVRANTEVTMETLLQEMIDRDAIAVIPSPYYTCKQASSWDRSQTEVGGDNWFANKDHDRAFTIR